MTTVERLILINQYSIIEKLDPARARECQVAQQVLQEGYAGEYPQLFRNLDPTEMPEEECRIVQDILDMFLTLRAVKSDVVFPGFDGNNESAHLAYARFLIDQGKWAGTSIVNSHRPMLDRYRRMLASWRQSVDPGELTDADVTRIIDGPPEQSEDRSEDQSDVVTVSLEQPANRRVH